MSLFELRKQYELEEHRDLPRRTLQIAFGISLHLFRLQKEGEVSSLQERLPQGNTTHDGSQKEPIPEGRNCPLIATAPEIRDEGTAGFLESRLCFDLRITSENREHSRAQTPLIWTGGLGGIKKRKDFSSPVPNAPPRCPSIP